MAINYVTTTSGIHVPTSSNNGSNVALGLKQMGDDIDAAYTPSAWQSLGINPGIGGVGATPGARKEAAGSIVRLRGGLQNTSGSSAPLSATIPTGYRPLYDFYFPVFVFGVGPSQVKFIAATGGITTVDSSGTIVSVPNAASLALEGISYAL